MISKRRVGLLVAALFFIAIGGFVAYVLQPVCVPLSDEDLKSFNVPIEQRDDRDFYLRVLSEAKRAVVSMQDAPVASVFLLTSGRFRDAREKQVPRLRREARLRSG